MSAWERAMSTRASIIFRVEEAIDVFREDHAVTLGLTRIRSVLGRREGGHALTLHHVTSDIGAETVIARWQQPLPHSPREIIETARRRKLPPTKEQIDALALVEEMLADGAKQSKSLFELAADREIRDVALRWAFAELGCRSWKERGVKNGPFMWGLPSAEESRCAPRLNGSSMEVPFAPPSAAPFPAPYSLWDLAAPFSDQNGVNPVAHSGAQVTPKEPGPTIPPHLLAVFEHCAQQANAQLLYHQLPEAESDRTEALQQIVLEVLKRHAPDDVQGAWLPAILGRLRAFLKL